jgi:hypothetical protein
MRIDLLRGTVLGAVACFALAFIAPMGASAQFSAPSPDSALSIPKAQLMQPEELNRLLQAKGANKPLVLQVGSRVMFEQAHITGSEYAGPGSQEAGRKLLKDRVSALPHSTFIVLYCGCCPWERCPNMGPAFRLLHELGFTNVKALYMADNFGANWMDKGYAVERGH